MPDVKISELPAGTATANAIVPATNAAGTATEKVTLGDIAALVADASQLTTGTLDDARLSANVILADDPRWLALAPAAPTLTASEGNASASLSWTAQSSLLTITDYIIQYSIDSGATWTTVSDGVSTGTSYEVTGLTNGTEHTFRVAAVSGVGQGEWSNSVAVTPTDAPSDPHFASVGLLLQGDLTDRSANPLTLSTSGSVSVSGTQTKYSSTSVFLDGGYIRMPGFDGSVVVPQIACETGDFTIESWVYITRAFGGAYFIGGNQNISGSSATAGGPEFGNFGGNGDWGLTRQVPSDIALFLSPPPQNQWVHIAIVRDSGIARVYYDGVQQGDTSGKTGSQSFDGFDIKQFRFIGQNTTSGSDPLRGYIDQYRFTKGVCRYPGGTTFTPPADAFPTR